MKIRLNNVKIFKSKKKPDGDQRAVIEVSPGLEESFKDGVGAFLEIELMKGTTEKLEDGFTRFTFELSPEKAKILIEQLDRAIFGTRNLN